MCLLQARRAVTLTRCVQMRCLSSCSRIRPHTKLFISWLAVHLFWITLDCNTNVHQRSAEARGLAYAVTLTAQGVMHSPLELRCCNNISGLHNPAPRTRRLRQQTPLICQTRSTNKGSGVVMRELPLPGSKTPQPINRATQMYVLEPAAQQASNGQTNSTWTAARQDAARQNSNLEASTSSSPNGVSFETHQQSSTARANDSVRNGNKRMLDAKTYDVTSSVNQAAPGFTTASRLAAASNDQRARSLIAEAESQSK